MIFYYLPMLVSQDAAGVGMYQLALPRIITLPEIIHGYVDGMANFPSTKQVVFTPLP